MAFTLRYSSHPGKHIYTVHPADQEHQQSSTQRGEGDEEDLMKATLRALADQTVTRGAGGATSTGTGANVEEDLLSDELLERLAAQLQGLGGFPSGGEGGGGGGDGHGEDHPTSTDSESLPPGMASLVDSIMHQLISKEVLYQPMKDIGAKYPEWLSSHRGTLTPDEVTQYEEQHAYIQKICGVYETDPGNYPKLIELLQEVCVCVITTTQSCLFYINMHAFILISLRTTHY